MINTWNEILKSLMVSKEDEEKIQNEINKLSEELQDNSALKYFNRFTDLIKDMYEEQQQQQQVKSSSICKCNSNNIPNIYFEVVSDKYRKYPNSDIKLPSIGTAGSDGHDFYMPETITIEPHSCSEVIFTDVKAKFPQGYSLLLLVRSSIGNKKNLMLCNTIGLIDQDYYNNPDNDGNIGIKLFNYGNTPVTLEKGERVVQGLFIKTYKALSSSIINKERSGGFGSTNK